MPTNPLANIDFDATTFGSLTSCQVVTNLCQINASYVPGKIPGDIEYICGLATAGLNLAGNLSDIRSVGNDSITAGYSFALQKYTGPTFEKEVDRSTSRAKGEKRNLYGPTFYNAAVLQASIEFLGNSNLLANRTVVAESGPFTRYASSILPVRPQCRIWYVQSRQTIT